MKKPPLKFLEYFFNVKTAFIILVFATLGYLIALEEEGVFTKNFLHFGPTDITFMHIKVDTWLKVFTVYLIGFLSAFLIAYYNSVSYNFIHQYLWNPAYTERLDITKRWVRVIVFFEPIIYGILMVLSLFVNITLQLQFIIPGILGRISIDIPYNLYMVEQNKFKEN